MSPKDYYCLFLFFLRVFPPKDGNRAEGGRYLRILNSPVH
uniref:Unclassified n=1 Tax=Fusarium pseudograminearum CS3427 TaxID=1318457 RepID=W1IBB2_FUSPS|nr:unclassified [Fusarium pseudograminearum CS3427]CDX48409.1 unclassified [Fusarium pseudograminearum CS3427]